MTNQTIEDQLSEWKMRVEICHEILKKIPLCNTDKEEDVIHRDYYYFIFEERNRNRRMVEAIEKYLL